jgi:transcriptional regulator with XRE-family HTH domain
MGVHEWGKRGVRQREVISRQVPAIVTEAIWNKAQQTLQQNFLFGLRSARNQYLLRGLIKCGLCGMTYVGIAANRPNGKREFYYRCNGAHSPQVYWGLTAGRCTSKAVRGDHLEAQVWSDVESFLRNPQAVLEQLHARLEADSKGSDQIRTQVARLEGLVTQKATERSRVVGLYRRGRLTDADLDAQMDEIGKEEAALEVQIGELRSRIAGADAIGSTISSAEALLMDLRKRLDEPVSWDEKRRLVEVLVAGIRVDTVEEFGVKQNKTTVTYRFSQPGEPMPLLVPQEYGGSRVVRIPIQPRTIGDHIRRRRLALKLLQKEVADQIGVEKTSVCNWEANTCQPGIHYMPAIIRFLGYNPLPEAKTLADRLMRHRTSFGLSQKELAAELAVDPGTLARWERGEREPTGAWLECVTRLLADDGSKRVGVRRVG